MMDAQALLERAAHLQLLAASEPDPYVRADLRMLAEEYEEAAQSAGGASLAMAITFPR